MSKFYVVAKNFEHTEWPEEIYGPYATIDEANDVARDCQVVAETAVIRTYTMEEF